MFTGYGCKHEPDFLEQFPQPAPPPPPPRSPPLEDVCMQILYNDANLKTSREHSTPLQYAASPDGYRAVDGVRFWHMRRAFIQASEDVHWTH